MAYTRVEWWVLSWVRSSFHSVSLAGVSAFSLDFGTEEPALAYLSDFLVVGLLT